MNKTFISMAAAVVSLAVVAPSCTSKKAAEEPATVSLAYSTECAGEENTIGEFPVDAEGYTVIFDGTSLQGWRGYGKDHLPERWSISADSCLHFVRGEGEGGDIIFGHKFNENFDVQFDWKVTEGANSGFFYLTEEKSNPEGHLFASYMSSPEYQILDNVNHPDAKLGVDGNRQSASLYDMLPAKPQNSNPWGEWNSARVVVKDGKVTHYQNGEVVVEYELWTPEWTELLNNSKFAEASWPDAFNLLNTKHNGSFAFQDHGDEVFIRNIRVKEL